MTDAAVLRASAAHVFVDDLTTLQLDAQDEHHLSRVLRIRPSDVVTVSDGRGRWLPARLEHGALRPSGPPSAPQPPPHTAVWSAIPKGDRPEWMVQKLTELGAGTIGWLHCARSVVRWEDDRALRHVERCRRVAREAAMQSRRLWLPQVVGPLPVSELDAEVVFAEPGAGPLPVGSTAVAIGPEGGWSDDELAGALTTASLGAHVLRVETAALVAATLLAVRH